ncbi:hypothetical protein AB0K09_15490 [Streptomyces sp. NPDC049577]|uniref:hypothetical protein n=1 Tax=Streptomyces sp. NPDC049577 TaxID=3155153 RepID=UPI0034195795
MNSRRLTGTTLTALAAVVLVAFSSPTASAESTGCRTVASKKAPSGYTLACSEPGPEFPFFRQEIERRTPFVTPQLQAKHSCGELSRHDTIMYFEARDKCRATARYLVVNGGELHR